MNPNFMEDKGKLTINLPEELQNGKYANLAMITHSQSEFVLDYIAIMPALDRANTVARVVLTPDNAKRLLFALKDNIEKYEQEHGPIQLAQQKQPYPAFAKPQGEA